MEKSDKQDRLEMLREIERRVALLDEPETAPLKKFVESIKADVGRPLVWPDPLSGGTDARVMFLAINPTVDEGFYNMASIDFLHPAFLEAMQRVGLEREDIFYWSVVPWPVRSRFILHPGNPDVEEGIRLFKAFVPFLPNLQCIVLLGQSVKALELELAASTPERVQYFSTWSPDKRSKLTPEKQLDIENVLKKAKEILGKRKSLPAANRVKPKKKESFRAYEHVAA